MTAVPWSELASRLRPFVAKRVADADVDDVLQDVLLRMHRGVGALADEQRFTGWMYQVARSAIAEHGRTRARHPLARGDEPTDGPAEPVHEDRVVADALASCLTIFVDQLPSPYREAITLVELEQRTIREAAELAGVSVSGMKSRVQRGRAQLRELLDACCAIELDTRNKVTGVVSRRSACCGPGTSPPPRPGTAS